MSHVTLKTTSFAYMLSSPVRASQKIRFSGSGPTLKMNSWFCSVLSAVCAGPIIQIYSKFSRSFWPNIFQGMGIQQLFHKYQQDLCFGGTSLIEARYTALLKGDNPKLQAVLK